MIIDSSPTWMTVVRCSGQVYFFSRTLYVGLRLKRITPSRPLTSLTGPTPGSGHSRSSPRRSPRRHAIRSSASSGLVVYTTFGGLVKWPAKGLRYENMGRVWTGLG